MIDELSKREELIKRYTGWFDGHTCKNWDTEVMLREFANEIIPLNADGNSRQVEQRVINFLRKGLPIFHFMRHKVIKYRNTIPSINQQINYLRYVLYMHKNYPEDLDQNVGLKPSFENYILEEINFRIYLTEQAKNL